MSKPALSLLTPVGKTLLLVGVALSLVAGCNKPKESSGQVVAKVNGTEISIHQLNSALSRTPGVTPQNADAFRAKVLDRLIDQQLAIGKAKEKELDRTPEVIESVEEAKRDILSRSYLEKIGATVPKSTEEETRAFYKEHPELFADRHVYQIQELAFPAAANAPVESLMKLMTTQPTEDVEKFLKDKKIEYSLSKGVRAAEALNPAAVKKLRSLEIGQASMLQTGGTVSILKLLGAQSAPVDESVALPQIRQMLDNQKSLTAMKMELQRLREHGVVEVTGADSKTTLQKKDSSPAGSAVSAIPAAAATPAPASTPPVPAPALPAPAPTAKGQATSATGLLTTTATGIPPQPGSKPADNIETGVAGLK